jgi:negative regulator of flagellin synthesis FlgM
MNWIDEIGMRMVMCVDNSRSSAMRPGEALRPEVRIEKILEIKRQLGEGRYDLAERLDLALDRVLEDLLG